MGKISGFLDYQRRVAPNRDAGERIHDWLEIGLPLEPEEVRIQGARCMNCGVPFCQSGVLLGGRTAGCPVHQLIPEWNELVYQGQWKEAFERLARNNPFPEFTGRVCPAPCEGSCTEGLNLEPVAIKCIEEAIIEKAFKEGWVKPSVAVASGKKVAVVGSGPAGLAAAWYLNAVGHEVIVYERNDRAGGLLTYGIPNMKLEKMVVERRLDLMRRSGIRFVLNTEVGRDVLAVDLVDGHDAVLFACGATQPRRIDVEGSEIGGIHFAVDFLTANTKKLLDSNTLEDSYLNSKDRNVVILGGGDTGTDCVATALRHGCRSVRQFEILPCQPKERQKTSNPWPEWPLKLKTDYGQEEAIALTGRDPRNYCLSVKSFVGDSDGMVREVVTVEVDWIPDASGKLNPREIPDSEKSWQADFVLLAMGFIGPEDLIPGQLGLDLDERSCVKAGYGSFATNVDKVFAAGDMRRGQSLVVWAIQEGKLAAGAMDRFLTGRNII